MKLSVATAHSSEAGFTLVELLVALALFGLLSLALFGSVRVGMTAWMHGTTRADQVDQSLHVQTLLRHLIEDAYPQFISERPSGGHIDFDGTNHSLDFLAAAPIALGTGGRSRFNLSVRPHGNLADLILGSNLELAWRESAPQPATKALLAGAERAEFSYFGMRRSDRVVAWHDRWSGETTLPQLVRIQVRFAADDPRVWPDLVIVPRVAIDVGCQFDPLTKRCRGR